MARHKHPTSAAPTFDMDELARHVERQSAIAAQLLEKDPTLGVTAYIIAGDIMSVERAEAMVKAGMSIEKASVFIGSYLRLKWLVGKFRAGKLNTAWLLKEFPREWSMSDPDDTDPAMAELWYMGWAFNAQQPLTYSKKLPPGETFTIYRGQDKAGDRMGLSWTLDRKVAVRFAKGAALRQRNRAGVVVCAEVKRSDIYGYLTGRGESEIIADPANVRVTNVDAIAATNDQL